MIDTSNKKVKRRLSKKVVYFLYIISIILFVIFAEILTHKEINDIILSSISYKEKASIDYKVNFKENPFYHESKGKGDLIVSQYVSDIDATFNYYVNYTDVLSGDYTYSIKGILRVYEPGEEKNELWSKEYPLLEEKEISFDHKNDYRITENIKLDYEQYLTDYNLFKSKTPIGSSAKLEVIMSVTNRGRYPGVNQIKFDSSEKLTIPISYNSFYIEDSVNIKKDKQTVSQIANNKKEKMLHVSHGIMFWVIAIVLGINFLITYNNNVKKENLFDRKVKKILSSYDSVIVRIEKVPVLKDMNVVEVSTIDELIDAQNEMRLPINFIEDKKRKVARFFIIKNNVVWIYALREGDLNDEK